MSSSYVSLFAFLTLLIGPCRAFTQSQPNPVGSYTYRFSDREGRPSECDCDYYEDQIDLHTDGTFLYKQQQGRLEPKQQWEKGTWSMRNDSLIDLVTTAEKGDIVVFSKDKKDPNQWHPSIGHETYIFDRHRLFNWERSKVFH